MTDPQTIAEEALGRLSVTPPAPKDQAKGGDAGQDESINKRLERNPESKEAQLDTALDESMDASDPPSSTQPGLGHDPARSSGYDPEAEKKHKR